jgi:hypothetical protein
LLEWKDSVDESKRDDDRHFAALSFRVGELESACASKAEAAEVHRVFVKREAFGEVMRAMGADVDTRAVQRDLLAALERIQVNECTWHVTV